MYKGHKLERLIALCHVPCGCRESGLEIKDGFHFMSAILSRMFLEGHSCFPFFDIRDACLAL